MRTSSADRIVRGLTLGAAAAMLATLPVPRVLAEAGAPGGAVTGGPTQIARNYVVRMQERVSKADEAALRANQLLADGDYEGAIREFRAALDLLPDAPMTEDRRIAYTQQFAKASVRLARQRADEGEYEQAIALVTEVLKPSVDPDNLEAKKLLEQLNDPEYYRPAMTPELIARTRQVEQALKVAQGAYELGDFDAADDAYYQVLNLDRYNKAARHGLEHVEHERLNYYETARDHTRAAFLRRIAEGWELPVPVSLTIEGPTGPIVDDDADLIQRITTKLQTIVIPSIEFVETPLRDALEFLHQKSVELDNDPNPNQRGVDFIINAGGSGLGGGGGAPGAAAPGGGGLGFEGGAAPAGGGGTFGGGDPSMTPITLALNNAPLSEALRYTVNAAGLKYKVEPHAVLIVPLSTPDKDLHTKTYIVPPNFLSIQGGDAGGGAPAVVDPFAAPAAGGGGGSGIGPKATAHEVLQAAGVNFPEGASAVYISGNSQLIVRNTLDQLELVEAYIESIRLAGERQIDISTNFVEVSEEQNEELGFDWLLGPFNITSSAKTFGAGGTTGTGASLSPSDFVFTPPGSTIPVGSNPVTAGLRSGTTAVSGNSIDALIAEAAGQSQQTEQVAPAIFGLGGIFTDPQFQVVIRALNQRKGVDLLSAPRVLARSGQRAKMEVIREFIYPTEYDPPEIPNEVGTSTFGGGGGGGTFPVTPANPTAFETRNTGVTLEVDPQIGPDGFTIDMSLTPEVVEFEGFINYGSPIQTAGVDPLTGATQPIVLTENRIEMPVFNTRKVTTQVTIWDGQTVAIGGLIREDIQDIEDKVPLIGDLPVFGRLFRSSVELHLKRNLTIFVTARLIDAAGQPLYELQSQGQTLPEGTPPPPPVTPSRPVDK